MGGIEIGFKYSGQPATCYRCQSTEHVVKDCPKHRHVPPRWEEKPQPEEEVSADEDEQPGEGMDTAPTLFNSSEGARSYAEATAVPSRSETMTENALRFADNIREEEEEAMDKLLASRRRKRDSPPLRQAAMTNRGPHKKI